MTVQTPQSAAVADMQPLLMNFESLGRNCEFGLFQRRFQAEPLGLLRWSSVAVDPLIDALHARFEGFGTPEQSEIFVSRDEYWIKDLRFNITSHTAIRQVKADIDYVRKKQFPILTYLKSLLLSYLDEGKRIFVYQHKHLTDEKMSRLFDAIQSFGPNILLCVREADGSHRAGQLEIRNQHFLVGFIDREGVPGPTGWNISTDLWTAFCHAAYKQWCSVGNGPRDQFVDRS